MWAVKESLRIFQRCLEGPKVIPGVPLWYSIVEDLLMITDKVLRVVEK